MGRDLFLQRASSLAAHSPGERAVVMLDVDGLRGINQGIGTWAGDEVLAKVGQRLIDAGRPTDVVARIGGDEYAVLMLDLAGEDEARVLATRLAWAVEREYTIASHEVPVRVSMGVAVSTQFHREPAALLADAESAMYAAKGREQGRVVVYSDALRQRVADQFARETAMRRAVAHDAFVLQYQPQLDLRTGEIVGVEALVRWPDARAEWVSPSEFIALAEHTGLIVPLGHWILSTATAQAAAWLGEGRNVGISINVSARQLADPDFIFQVRDLLASSAVPAEAITLEITESQVMRNFETTVPAMHTLRSFGLRLSIDDFGTGYASLAQLKNVPGDELKIDRSFISGLESDHRDRGITSAIVGVAHALGMTVVAEGVETEGQRAFLERIGCDFAQGFLLGIPQPPADVLAGGSLPPRGAM